MSQRGIIYLIQPGLLVGSKIYKLGYSNSPTLSRCINGYIKGTLSKKSEDFLDNLAEEKVLTFSPGSRYISIHECYDPSIVEKILIKKFKNLFTLAGGNENFEGDENIMCMTILQTIIEYKQNNAPSNNTTNTPTNDIPNNTTNNTSTNTTNNTPNDIIPINIPTNIPNDTTNDTTNESLINNKHSVINYYCKICKSYYSSYQSLWIHNKKYHINNCEKCNKKFDNLQNKLIHQKNCSGGSNQNVKLVNNNSANSSITNNISNNQTNTTELIHNKTNNLLCKYCNKIFSRIDSLNRHYISCKIKKQQKITIKDNKELEEMIKAVIIKMNNKTTDNINDIITNENS